MHLSVGRHHKSLSHFTANAKSQKPKFLRFLSKFYLKHLGKKICLEACTHSPLIGQWSARVRTPFNQLLHATSRTLIGVIRFLPIDRYAAIDDWGAFCESQQSVLLDAASWLFPVFCAHLPLVLLLLPFLHPSAVLKSFLTTHGEQSPAVALNCTCSFSLLVVMPVYGFIVLCHTYMHVTRHRVSFAISFNRLLIHSYLYVSLNKRANFCSV